MSGWGLITGGRMKLFFDDESLDGQQRRSVGRHVRFGHGQHGRVPFHVVWTEAIDRLDTTLPIGSAR
jgi:hypothetical protein